MRSRARLIATVSALGIIAVCAAGPSAGSPLKARHPKTTGGGGGSVDTTLTIRGTQSQVVDLTTALTGCTNTELIDATYTGSVAMQRSPGDNYDRGVPGSARHLRKRELLDFTTAETSGLADQTSASIWTFSCSGGTYKIGWNVASPEINAWPMGVNTLERRGGFPLYHLPGSAADWAITTNPSSGFEIWNSRVVLKCSGSGTDCPTEASNPPYESTIAATRAITPTAGTTYNVVVQNLTLGVTRTIAITMVDHQTDVAPSSTHLTATAAVGGQYCDAVSIKDQGPSVHNNWGDTVVFEGSKEHLQQYNYAAGAGCDNYAITTTRAGGPGIPTLPGDAGWITVKSREPLGAQISGVLMDTRGRTAASCSECGAHFPTGLRLTGLDTYTLGGSGFTFRNFGVGGNYWSLTWLDHSKVGSTTWANFAQDGQYNLFVTYNYIDPSVSGCNGAFLFGIDSQFKGNWITNGCHDGLDQALTNSNPANPIAEISFNTIVNLGYQWDGQHNDFMQAFYGGGGGPPWLNAAGVMGEFSGPRIVGNLLVHGVVPVTATMVTNSAGFLSAGDIGTKDTIDGEGILEGDVGQLGEKRVASQIVGNLVVGSFSNGFLRQWVANGAVINHNTLVYPNYVQFGLGRPIISVGGTGDPSIGIGGPGAKDTITNNALSGSLISYTGVAFSGTGSALPPTPILANNQLGLGPDNAGYLANFKDPNNTDYSTKEAIIDHWQPKAGSAFATSGAGAFWDTTKVDIRGQTVGDTTVFNRDGSLIDSPVCTLAETIVGDWTGTAVAGKTASSSVAPTFNGSPTSSESNWLLISPEGYLVVGTGATYSFVSGDLTRTTPRTIVHLTIKANAGGKGVCSSNALSF